MKIARLIAAAIVTLCFVQVPAFAEDYPTRPVSIISPYAPGGSVDIIARLLAQNLQQRLGGSFVVVDRPGAGGVIASTAAAQAQPDGYTLLQGTSTQLAIDATLHKKLPYNPVKDFVPLALITKVPFVLVVNPSVPAKSVNELIKYAKANPGKLSFGSGGVGAAHHLFMELFMSMTGTKMVHVPYKGSLPALRDVIAGRIPLMFVDLAPSLPFIRNGNVRALGVSTATRLPQLPDVPPVADSVPGFEAVAWQMIVTRSGTPKPVVDKLHAALKNVEALPEFKSRITKLGMVPVDTPSVAELQAYLKSEIARWGKIIEKAGIGGD